MSYVSYACSKYHDWFRDLGYPLLDIHQYPDGEWAIIQYFTVPVVPAITRWNVILSGMRNIEISRGFVEKYVKKLDNKRKEFWDDQEKKTKAIVEEQKRVEQHREDYADQAFKAIKFNPDLMERVGRKGLQEINLENIRKNIPRSQLIGLK